LVEGLVAFSVLMRKKLTIPVSDPFLQSKFAAQHLGKSLIHFYVDVEVTGGIFFASSNILPLIFSEFPIL
jgi:hypothetical protein